MYVLLALFTALQPILAHAATSLPHTIDPSAVGHWISNGWSHFMDWLSQPYVYSCIMAWWITFTVVVTLCLCLGFGPAGVVAGSLAAAFQSWMYGGFTPAAGLFATLTSLGMLGWFVPLVTVPAAIVATIITAVVWGIGVGR